MPSNLCITVVEDNESLCAVTVELLAQQGHRVKGVHSAEALCDEASDGMLDVLLVDLNLPGEDGISLIGRYRQIYPGLKVVVLSSRDGLQDRLACYQAGADTFLAKPTHPDELLAVIGSLTRSREAAEAVAASEGHDTPSTLQLDMKRLVLEGPSATVDIGAAAAKILAALALAPGQRLAQWQIVEALGQQAGQYTSAALGVRMVRLRQLIKEAGHEGASIRSVRSEGYQLCLRVVIG
jgi:DNA-binding response OmpR family regulator